MIICSCVYSTRYICMIACAAMSCSVDCTSSSTKAKACTTHTCTTRADSLSYTTTERLPQLFPPPASPFVCPSLFAVVVVCCCVQLVPQAPRQQQQHHYHKPKMTGLKVFVSAFAALSASGVWDKTRFPHFPLQVCSQPLLLYYCCRQCGLVLSLFSHKR